MTLTTLNNGYPFSDHPMSSPLRLELRTGTCPTACDCGSSRCHEFHRPWWQEQAHNPLTCVAHVRRRQLYIVCGQPGCVQAMAVLSEPSDVAADPDRPAAVTTNLGELKARVADHWFKCHAGLIEDLTRT